MEGQSPKSIADSAWAVAGTCDEACEATTRTRPFSDSDDFPVEKSR